MPASCVCVAVESFPGFSVSVQVFPLQVPPAAAHDASQPVVTPPDDDAPPPLLLPPRFNPLDPPPETPLDVGFDDIGGYKLGVVNNTAYKNHKILQVYWAGAKYTMLSKLDLIASFYGLSQNSYATGANTGCSSNVSGSCSGHEIVASFSADYRFTKRFDVYAGAMYTSVYDGMASGFIQTNNINPTVGFRFRF